MITQTGSRTPTINQVLFLIQLIKASEASLLPPVASVFFFDVYYFDNAKEKTFKDRRRPSKRAISNAQAELKSVRLELGLDVPKKKSRGEW